MSDKQKVEKLKVGKQKVGKQKVGKKRAFPDQLTTSPTFLTFQLTNIPTNKPVAFVDRIDQEFEVTDELKNNNVSN